MCIRDRYTAEGVIMVCLFHDTGRVDNYPIVALMVFQVVAILTVGKGVIAFSGKQELLRAAFIDHVCTVIGCDSSATYLMGSSELCSVCCISVGDGIATVERYYAWQI